MTDTETEASGGGGSGPGGPVARAAAVLLSGIGHLIGVASVAVVLALLSANRRTVEMYWMALSDPAFDPAWSNFAWHFLLSAAAWALLVAAFRFAHRRFRESPDRPRRLARADRGSVMVETLIVIVPFLLLTSGLAQLALRNTAAILADLAYYKGARAAWIWEPEIDHDRGDAQIGVNDVERRARLASAAALAPTAPSSFTVDDPGDQELDQLRTVMFATFDGNPDADIGNALARGGNSAGEEQSFARAFDEESFRDRAARKLTFAYLALDEFELVERTDGVSVEFDYKFNVVFPWFAYIFGGGTETVGGRHGYYVTIERPRDGRTGNDYLLPRQSEL